MTWTFDGRTFDMDDIVQEEIVQLGALEIWEFINDGVQSGMMGMMGGMARPIHIHGLQFQVIERRPPSDATLRANWETVSGGYVDEGWQDTFLLMPGEQVRVLLKFTDYPGIFVYHCHNLEHEDMGMMRNYLIEA